MGFKCPDCDKIFSRLDNLHKHARVVHNKPHIKCPHCEYSATKSGQIMEHSAAEHNDGGVERPSFECDECKSILSSKKNLDIHRIRVHAKKHACPDCDYRTGRPERMRDHRKARHGPH